MRTTAAQRRAINAIMTHTRIDRAGTDAIKLYGPGADTYFIATTYPHRAGYSMLRPTLTGAGQTQGGAREELLGEVIEEVTGAL